MCEKAPLSVNQTKDTLIQADNRHEDHCWHHKYHQKAYALETQGLNAQEVATKNQSNITETRILFCKSSTPLCECRSRVV